MPQLIAGVFIPTLFVITNSYAITMALSLAIGYAATAYALYALNDLLFTPETPKVPKPEDGKYNLKQNVPSLAYVLGRVHKGGDYVFLEEAGGVATHITVVAGHSINGFVRHRLHDEDVTLEEDGAVATPAHFQSKVNLQTRDGADAETAYADVVAAFSSIWTADHRGDGLASVLMQCETVAAEKYQKVYPQQMPVQTHVIEGNDQLYDPRTETYGYSTNLALFRLWHLTHPVGGKLTLDDMYLPDWAAAADVCDEQVTNRDEETENRYHGGLWFRADNNPVEVGRTIDQAGELICYERPDGKVGVHAGKFVEPDIRLTEADILTLSYDANKRQATTVLAVRGQYTNPDANYVTADAAPYGDPYIDGDNERTRTIKNQAVQSHNHMARLEKIAYIRANAPRVTVLAHYDSAKDVPYRRFIRVHVPPRLDEAVIELTGRPRLSLRNLTVEFQGIVVPATLYDFDAATDEGVPGGVIEAVEASGVPDPVNFDVVIQTEVVSGGGTAAYALASWDAVSDALVYELEWEPSAGGTKQSVTSVAGETEVRSGFLADGVEYRFRLRTWSAGVTSDWTDYELRTATADPVAPAAVTGVSGTGGSGSFTFDWTAPNSGNYFAARLYLNTADDFGTATLVATEYGAPSDVENREITGLSADDYYGWVEAINASGVAASPVATGVKTVS
ncbi:MAG: hypothetical protein KDJ90_21720 [Nitratireductor sp.]|nr:hypothetical protein [Nitratireductor sp.]